jgi:hypothetical protein
MNPMIVVLMGELEHIPRGPRGSAQNLYRAAFTAARFNTLGRRPQITPTAAAAHALALSCMTAASPEWAGFGASRNRRARDPYQRPMRLAPSWIPCSAQTRRVRWRGDHPLRDHARCAILKS